MRVGATATEGVTERGRAILEHLEAHRDAMVDFLVTLARQESPSDEPAAQRATQDTLRAAFEDLGYRVRHVPGVLTGGHLFAVPADRPRGRPGQLLVGHSDTVWPGRWTMPCQR